MAVIRAMAGFFIGLFVAALFGCLLSFVVGLAFDLFGTQKSSTSLSYIIPMVFIPTGSIIGGIVGFISSLTSNRKVGLIVGGIIGLIIPIITWYFASPSDVAHSIGYALIGLSTGLFTAYLMHWIIQSDILM